MSTRTPAADDVLRHFRWVDGDADIWNMLRDPTSMRSIVSELAELCASEDPDVIVGIEARGLVFAPLVALTLGAGFTPVRKGGALFPGETASIESAPDYRNRTQRLSARKDHVGPGIRAALVDDWIETGSQAIAAQQLVEGLGAELVNVTVVIDEASEVARESLPVIHSILSADDLPPYATVGGAAT